MSNWNFSSILLNLAANKQKVQTECKTLTTWTAYLKWILWPLSTPHPNLYLLNSWTMRTDSSPSPNPFFLKLNSMLIVRKKMMITSLQFLPRDWLVSKRFKTIIRDFINSRRTLFLLQEAYRIKFMSSITIRIKIWKYKYPKLFPLKMLKSWFFDKLRTS